MLVLARMMDLVARLHDMCPEVKHQQYLSQVAISVICNQTNHNVLPVVLDGLAVIHILLQRQRCTDHVH